MKPKQGFYTVTEDDVGKTIYHNGRKAETVEFVCRMPSMTKKELKQFHKIVKEYFELLENEAKEN